MRILLVDARYNIHHPYIVRTRAVIETTDWIFIVMELMGGGGLQENIEKRGTYTEGDAAEVMLRLSLTLGFLHSKGARNFSYHISCMLLIERVRAGIAHRDVKPENILCGNTHADVKLADFGFANILGSSHSGGFRSSVGTPVFMAPEIGDAGGYSCAVDVWSAVRLIPSRAV